MCRYQWSQDSGVSLWEGWLHCGSGNSTCYFPECFLFHELFDSHTTPVRGKARAILPIWQMREQKLKMTQVSLEFRCLECIPIHLSINVHSSPR